MAAIVGIVARLVGPAIELGKWIAVPIKRQFNYLCCFNSNIQNLKDEAKSLEDAREGLEMRVTRAHNNVEEIVPEVNSWLEDAKELVQVKMTGIVSRIENIQSGCLAIKSRFLLSREAKKTTEAMEKLRGRCNFNPISQPVPSAGIEPIPIGSTYEFESRKHIEEDIMTNLKDEKVNMIGICGMGGVGKTTTAKRIENRVWKEHLFDEIVMVVVSQQVERLKIQDEIAKSLGLTLGEGSLPSRARILHARLVGGKRILIILDDVWEKLILGDLGIPCESGLERCKILLTSRNSEILNQMKVQKVYELKVLSEREAWNLFKSNVGTWIEDHDVLSVAQEVVKECNGLPIALVVVGAALKDKKNRPIWTDVLRQLQKANPTAMPNILNGVYKPLRLSYEYLKNKQAESLFLLCCLFREDGHIPLEYLAVYAMGLRMFEDIEDLEQARNRTETLVETLRSRFLLLKGWNEHHVRMHDVVRDVSIFIASEERRINCNNCSWISPFLRNRIKLPIPQLRLLLIDEWVDKELEIKDNFFEGMSGLNVLSMNHVSGRLLPHTTQLLKNLQTLLLLSCRRLETISVVGKLESLEILICRDCYSIENLPVEIGGLNRLKLLEFSSCEKLKTIVPGVISRLVELEELKMEASFDKWEANDKGEKRKNAALSELESLSKLTCLEIEIEDYTLAAEQINLPSKIVKYDITIGDCGDSRHPYFKYFEKMSRQFEKKNFNMEFEEKMLFKRKMRLHLPREITLGNWIHECVRSVEYIWLKGDGSNNLDLGQAQNTIRSLVLRDCSTVKKLMNITSRITTVFPRLESLMLLHLPNLEEICDGPIPEGSPNSAFKNLKYLILHGLPALKHLWKNPNQNVVSLFGNNVLSSITIRGCDSLHNLSSLALANDFLLQLERLEIWNCEMVEQVLLWNEEENEKDITFPKLKSLDLYKLPNLTTFCKGIESIEFPLLTSLEINCCPKLKSAVSVKDFLLQLERLEIRNCEMMEQVLLWNEEENGKDITFPKLKSLKLHDLPNLTTFCKGIGSIEFPLLTSLEINSCPKLKSVVSAKNCLLQLESLEIWDCEMMEQVLLWNEEENGKDITFPKLKSLYLFGLPNLTTFCKGIESIEFPLLTSLRIEWVPKLKNVVSSITSSTENNQNNSEGPSHNHDHDFFHLFYKPKKAKDFLLQLEDLEILECEMMEQVLLWNEEENEKDITFPKLKRLQLYGLPNLTTFCKGIENIEFPLLTSLTIGGFPKLKNIVSSITSSTRNNQNNSDGTSHNHGHGFFHLFYEPKKAKDCLLQLESLEIFDCEMMEQVLLWNEEENGKDITFPKLKSLTLRQLPNLTTFCKGIESIKFPLLTQMMIQSCPQLKSIVASSTTSSIGNNNQNNSEGTSNNYDHDSFHLFCEPEKAKNCFLQLESLEIWDCEMMEQVLLLWNEEENGKYITFPKLKSLNLWNLPNLTTFCKGIESIEFPLITEMKIHKCPKLKSFVSGGINHDHSLHLFHELAKAKDCLLQLESLCINNCEMMEQVLLWNEEENGKDITFPKLKSLELCELPNLTTFCKGIESIAFPILTKMTIEYCPKLKCLFSGGINHDHSLHLFRELAKAMECLLQLESLEIGNCKMMEQVLIWNEEENEKDIGQSRSHHHITFTKLKRLSLRHLPNLTTFAKGIESIELPLLTSLTIWGFPKLKNVVSSITSSTGNNQNNSEGTSHNHGHEFFNLFCEPEQAKDCLLQLESLEIRDCEMMKQVLLWNEEENGKDITFLKLESLTLGNLPNLTTFCKGIESIKFPLLTKMRIHSCPQLKSAVASSTTSSIGNNNQNNSEGTIHNHDHDSFHLFCEPEKVAFGSLKELNITADEHPILTLWCHQISFGFFTRLEELKISGFDNIRSLFSSSIAGNLVNLNNLKISHCGKMVKVIEDDEEKDACGGESTICLFPMLEWLTLSSLSNLKIFWEWRCALELPSLEYLEITECPQMKRFTLGSLTTPNLKEIEIDSKTIDNTEGLNGTLEQHFFRAKEESTLGEEKEEEGDEGEEKQEQEEMEEKEREEDQKKQGEIEEEEN